MRLRQRYGVLDEFCKLLRRGWSHDDAQVRKNFLSPGRNSSVVVHVVLLLQLSAYTAGFGMGQLQTVSKSAASDNLADKGLWSGLQFFAEMIKGLILLVTNTKHTSYNDRWMGFQLHKTTDGLSGTQAKINSRRTHACHMTNVLRLKFAHGHGNSVQRMDKLIRTNKN